MEGIHFCILLSLFVKRSYMNAICFGEILWDILPTGKVPGGAPMNVCYHLNRLAQQAALISKIGDDENGKELIRFLQDHQVVTSHIQTDAEKPTGTVIATQIGNEMEYDIVQPVAWDYIDITPSLLQMVKEADYFICGSLVARSEHSRTTLFELLKSAKNKIVDINLRPPHYTKDTVTALLQQADILKLNDHELTLIASWYTDTDTFEKQVHILSSTFTIPTILVTKGAHGATLFYQEQFYNHNGYKVQVADTIGSGDAFLAGFLSQHVSGALPDASLDFACRIGAFVASKKGACPDYTLQDILNVIQ